MRLLGKTEKKHQRDLPPTCPPPQRQHLLSECFTVQCRKAFEPYRWDADLRILKVRDVASVSRRLVSPRSRGSAPRSRLGRPCVHHCFVLFFSCPRSDGWPHHGRTFSIYLCPLSFWLTLPQEVLSTYWCCPSRQCVVFLACVHLALFLALPLSLGNSLVSSSCDHRMLASLLWQCLTVPPLYSSFAKNPLISFLCCPWNPQNHSQSFHLKGVKTCFFILSECPAFTAVRGYRPH